MNSSEDAAIRWLKGIARWRLRLKEDPNLCEWFRNQMLTFIGCKQGECPMWRKTGCIADKCVRDDLGAIMRRKREARGGE